jgi:hypothetical protein
VLHIINLTKVEFNVKATQSETHKSIDDKLAIQLNIAKELIKCLAAIYICCKKELDGDSFQLPIYSTYELPEPKMSSTFVVTKDNMF